MGEIIAVVTGGRFNRDVPTIEGILSDFHAATPFVKLYHGDCRRYDALQQEVPTPDRIAHFWAEGAGIPIVACPAAWHIHGRAAGPIRNRQMLEDAKDEADRLGIPVKLFAFDGGRGTADCIRQARELGIAVIDGTTAGLAP